MKTQKQLGSTVGVKTKDREGGVKDTKDRGTRWVGGEDTKTPGKYRACQDTNDRD